MSDTTPKPHIVICGGGPAGVAAAIASARFGCQTTLIEVHPVLGGMGTAGLVNNFCGGYWDHQRFIIGGLFQEIRQQLIERGALYETRRMEPYEPNAYNQLLVELLDQANVKRIHGHKVVKATCVPTGVHLELDNGQEIQADGAVDATGDANIIHMAQLPTTFGRESDGAVMPVTMCYRITGIDLEKAKAGFPHFVDPRNGEHRPVYTDPHTGEVNFFHSGHSDFIDPMIVADREAGLLSIPRDHVAVIQGVPGCPGDATINYGRVFIDDPTDPQQLERATEASLLQVDDGIEFFKRNLPGFENIKLLETARVIGVRQSRQLVGEYQLKAEECLALAQFEDVIAQCNYMIDIHEPGSDKSTCILLPEGQHFDIPWRCLVPKGGQSRLVAAGRCISSDAGAMASFRVQAPGMAIGEAAGIGVAQAAKDGVELKDVDVKKIQQRLLAVGAILE